MARLPRIRTGAADLDIAFDQWNARLSVHLQNGAEPLLVPRNARTSRPAPSTIRVRWDPGGIHAEGHDIQYSETPDFAQSQSHRISGLKALFFDLVVQDARKRYFRIRSYHGGDVSRWSNIVAGTADVSGAAGALPGAVTFTPVLRNKFGFIGIKDITIAGDIPTDLTELHASFACVDEAAAQVNYAILGAINSSSNPVTVSATAIGDQNWFAVGDFIVIDDPSADTIQTTRRAYEIFEITALGANWTLRRAQLNSTMLAHASGLFAYRVDEEPLDPALGPNLFHTTPPATPSGIPDHEWELIPGVSVVAVVAQLRSPAGVGPVTTMNCAPLAYSLPAGDHTDNPAPGLRTLADDLYTLPLFGALTVGQSMTNRIQVREAFSLAGALCTLRIAAVGQAFFQGLFGGINCAVGAYLLYIEPPRLLLPHASRQVAVLDQWAVPENSYDSQRPLSFLYQRRVPYNLTWPFRGIVVGLLGQLWNLSTGAFDTASFPLVAQGEIAVEEGGELDVVVAQVGSTTAGSDLTGFALT